MLAGMYVVWQGETCQVTRIDSPPIGYRGRPPVTYTLQPVLGGPSRRVVDPLAADMPLTPACDPCGRPAGHAKCAALGSHDGPQRTIPKPIHEVREHGYGWCKGCRRKAQITSETVETTTTALGLAVDVVSELACGHVSIRDRGMRLWGKDNPAPWRVGA